MVIPEAVLVGAGVIGAAFSGFLGGKRGSAGALNGTAEAVRRIETGQIAQGEKLDSHIERTADSLTDLTGRVGAIEGKCLAVQMAKQWTQTK
jgi:hypothetical protein